MPQHFIPSHHDFLLASDDLLDLASEERLQNHTIIRHSSAYPNKQRITPKMTMGGSALYG